MVVKAHGYWRRGDGWSEEQVRVKARDTGIVVSTVWDEQGVDGSQSWRKEDVLKNPQREKVCVWSLVSTRTLQEDVQPLSPRWASLENLGCPPAIATGQAYRRSTSFSCSSSTLLTELRTAAC